MDVFVGSFASEARENRIDLFGIDEIPKPDMSEEIDMFDITQGMPNSERKMDTVKSETKKREISEEEIIDKKRKRRRFLTNASAAKDALNGDHFEPLDILSDLGFDVSEKMETYVFIDTFASEAGEKKIDLFGIEEIPKVDMSGEIDMSATIKPKTDILKKKKISNHQKRGKQKRDRKRKNISSARGQLEITHRRKRRRNLMKTAANDGGHTEQLSGLEVYVSDMITEEEKKTRALTQLPCQSVLLREKDERKTIVLPQLPYYVVFELLTKLPVKKLFQCMCVSKVWYSIILDNRFAEAYRNRNPLSLVVSNPRNQRFGEQQWNYSFSHIPRIYFSSFGDSESVNQFDVSIFNDSIQDSRLGVTQVINGLFCYYSLNQVFLANVFTHETMALPAPADLKSSITSQYYFGFNPVGVVYKLLSIGSRGHLSGCRVKILTIGRDSSWRELSDGDDIPDAFERQSSFVNGDLHWLHWTVCFRMYSFDLSKETFSLVPIPSSEIPFGFESDFRFVHFRGRLALYAIFPDPLIILTLEEEQKWNRHQVSVPEELWSDSRHLGNMPAGEIFYVDSGHTGPSHLCMLLIVH